MVMARLEIMTRQSIPHVKGEITAAMMILMIAVEEAEEVPILKTVDVQSPL